MIYFLILAISHALPLCFLITKERSSPHPSFQYKKSPDIPSTFGLYKYGAD
jgi:hypothetical protein